MVLPWFAIYGITWERPDFQSRPAKMSFGDGVRLLAQHTSFRRLTGLYLCGRISMDLTGAMLILYFTHWLGRSEDFETMMFIFLSSVLVSLPIWLRVARRMEKSTVFCIGTAWWMVGQLTLLAMQPDWPHWIILGFAPVIAIGYAVVDLMPWSMLGEVIDEDDLANGERREGVYNGFFMFVRKLAGTAAVALALALLGALGFSKEEQPEAAVTAIRWLASVGPAVFLALSLWFARDYPLTRAAHDRILASLAERSRAASAG
jgi:GPH family glycoside/pentoside/hexuronide:cation symporter